MNQGHTTELLKESELKDRIIEVKDQTIRNLEIQAGFLIPDHTRISGQFDRLLMPTLKERNKRQWWQIWK
ncbi:MAG TPA: hypothetical protein VF360_02905 [Candidatus Methanoperedens sp.]